MQLYKLAYARLHRAMALISFIALTSVTAFAEYVTGDNHVVYEVTNASLHEVKVSILNSSQFAKSDAQIVIPAIVVDTDEQSVTLGQEFTVVDIDPGAFAGTTITSFTLEAPLTVIPSKTFSGCVDLATVSIPQSVSTIQSEAFYGCPSLQSVSTLDGVTTIQSKAFMNCPKLDNITFGQALTKIEQSAFENCTSLSQIDIPDSVSDMGTQVFKGCSSLVSAIVGNGIASLPYETFRDCSSLASVTLKENLVTIERYCFYGCASLQFPSLPSSFRHFSYYSFANCDNLGTVTIPAGCDTELFSSYTGYTFYGSGITTLILPDTPCTLRQYDFQKVKTLSSVTIPAWMEETPKGLFQDAVDLSSVILSEGVAIVGEQTFQNCAALTTVSFPSSLRIIRQSAFNDDPSLHNFTLPDYMEKIETQAFYKCTAIRDLVLPPNVALASNSFGESRLYSITFPDTPMGEWELRPFGDQPYITEITFPGWLGTITESLCAGWTSLATVTFEEGITTIGPNAFYRYSTSSSLKKINFPPSSLRTIQTHAFSSTLLPYDVVIPEGVTSIENSAFENAGLHSITLPTTLQSLGSYAFSKCTELTRMSFSEGNCAIKSIEEYAFYDDSKLTQIDLPDGLESIGKSAFLSCAITSVTIPESLRTIGDLAFKTNQLTSVTIPAGIYVGNSAFESNEQIAQINLPSTPCSFGKDAFKYNSVITDFTFPDWMDKLPAGFCASWRAMKSVTLPAHLTTISEGVFSSCLKLETIYIADGDDLIAKLPDGVTVIEKDAFRGCAMLHDVVYPVALRTIGEYAFASCGTSYPTKFGPVVLYKTTLEPHAFDGAAITKIIFRDCPDIGDSALANQSSIEEIEFPECMTTIPDGFCYRWGNLKKVTLPATVVKIGTDAFRECGKLEEINLPEGLEIIGNTAFYRTGHLSEITFPNSLRRIGQEAFANLSNSSDGLKTIHWAENPTQKLSLAPKCFQYAKLTDLVIPANVDSIPQQAFGGCKPLTSVSWADRVDPIVIDMEAFANAAVTSVTFPDVATEMIRDCFTGCNYLTNIQFSRVIKPKIDVTGVGYYVGGIFRGCSSLEQVVIPGVMESVANYMFYHCTKLHTVVFEDGITEIGMDAFNDTGLKNITWANSITSIQHGAFQSTKLESLDWPATVDIIPSACFANCNLLTKVTIPDNVTTIEKDAFKNCGLMADLKISDNLTYIGESAFQSCQSLTGIAFPSSLSYIGISAFNSCSKLSDVTFNEGLAKIDNSAFYSSGITEITIPSTTTSIGAQAFASCKKLTKVTNKVDNLSLDNISVFYNCDQLREFISEKHVKRLANATFANCTALERVVVPEGDCIDQLGNQNSWTAGNGVFYNCKNLTEIPSLQHTMIFNYTFENCEKLRHIVLPERPDNYASIGYYDTYFNQKSPRYIFRGCKQLQSIEWTADDPYFNFMAADIVDAPLKGISYSYADNIVKVEKVGSIDATHNITNPLTSTLMVMRGQKYKYEEAGVGQLFNIVEMKAPKIELQGDIFSQFDEVNNINKYQAVIRWIVELSDLDSTKPTTLEIFRSDEDNPVNTITFQIPSDEIDVDDLDAATFSDKPSRTVTTNGKVIYVDLSYSHPNPEFSGQMDYPVTDANGKVTYQLIYGGRQTSRMYFDAVTHKRLDSFDYYGYASYLTVVDCFNSPELSSGKVPSSYTYTVKLSGYDYLKPVNLEAVDTVDADENLWEYQPDHIDDVVSDPYVMYTGMGMPHVSFKGLYTYDEIVKDNNIYDMLEVTPAHHECDRDYRLGLKLNRELIDQVGKDGSTTGHIIRSVRLERLGSTEYTDYPIPENNRTDSIEIKLPDTTAPNVTFQAITDAWFRGRFGSPTFTIPGNPTVGLTIDKIDMAHEDTSNVVSDSRKNQYHVDMTITPDVTSLGYENGLQPDDYHIGLWRTFTDKPWAGNKNPWALAESGDAELVHHVAYGRQTETHLDSCDADGCDYSTGDTVNDDGTISYSDAFDVPFGHLYNLDYAHRLYVKVPTSYLPAQQMYMLADTTEEDHEVTIVGNTEIDPYATDAVWYDLQGLPVTHPRRGHIYIVVTPTGSAKVQL